MAKNEYCIRVGAELDTKSVDQIYETLTSELSRSGKNFKIDTPQLQNSDEFRKSIAAMFNAGDEITKAFASLRLRTEEGCNEVVNVVLEKLADGRYKVAEAWNQFNNHGISHLSDLGGRIANGLLSSSGGNTAGLSRLLSHGFGADVAQAFVDAVVQSANERLAYSPDKYNKFFDSFRSGLPDSITIDVPRIVDSTIDENVATVHTNNERFDVQ